MSITLIYQNTLQYSEDFDTLIVQGMDEPDHLRKLVVVQEYKDGRLKEQIKGFNKVIRLRFLPTLSIKQRRFLASWFIAEEKSIIHVSPTLSTYISTGITDRELTSEWLYECEHNRCFDVQFFDSRCYKVWNDGLPPISSEDMMYCKFSIEMDDTKTEADPEVFTTNSGKLLVDAWGDPFPTFSALTHKFFVVMKSADGSSGDYPIADISINGGGNLVFETFPASGFVPAPSGKLYANFACWLQPKLV